MNPKKINFFLFILSLIILIFLSIHYNLTNAESPNFPRQVIIDRTNDVEYSEFYGSSMNKDLSCNRNSSTFPFSPDIEEVNYISDGKLLNVIIWFSNPFNEHTTINQFNASNSQPIKETNKIVVVIDENKEKKSFTEYIQEKLFSLRSLPSFKKLDESKTNLYNLTAHKIIYSYHKNSDLTAMKIWALDDNNDGIVYVFTYITDSDKFEKFEPLITAIKNTFMNQTNFQQFKLDNSDNLLKSYENNITNINIQYPRSWKLIENNTDIITISQNKSKEVFKKNARNIILSFDITSGYDVRGEDYRVYYKWNENSKDWKRIVVEMKSSKNGERKIEERVIEEKVIDDIGFGQGSNFANVYVNLSEFNFPDKYNVIPFVYDYYSNYDGICSLDIVDFGEEVPFPPLKDDFRFLFTPDNVILRQGEEKEIELQIKNNNMKINSTVSLSAEGTYYTQPNFTNILNNVNFSFIPSKVYLNPEGIASSILKIKVENNANVRPYTIATQANITIEGPLRTDIDKVSITTPGINLTKSFPIVITVLPKLTTYEIATDFANNIFDPIIGTIVAVIGLFTGGLGIRKWRGRHQKH